MQKIAIIGAGISGLSAAHFLKDRYELTVFENGICECEKEIWICNIKQSVFLCNFYKRMEYSNEIPWKFQ